MTHPSPISLGATEWRAIKVRIDTVFETLSSAGLVARGDAGYTQSDGFSDCSERFISRGVHEAGLQGFVFYTRQDIARVKETGELPLAIWGAPAGNPDDVMRVSELVVNAFRGAGFTVDWNGSPETRPSLHIMPDDLAVAAEIRREKDAEKRTKNREREMRSAVSAAGELFARKDFAAYVKKLEKYEKMLEPIHLKKLKFARQKLNSGKA